ncbi:MAG TPA: FkbM family methyltransferase [Flavobacterium sp.]|nr:FkbM family methyltransferase [Flavobacterium sp.]
MQNDLIKKYDCIDSIYELELCSNAAVVIRDFSYSDYRVFQQVFNNKEYEVILKILKENNLLSNDFIMIDAGANIGLTAMYFSYNLDNAKIFCIEPSAANAEICNKNINKLGSKNNVHVYNCALSEAIGKRYSIERDFRDKKDWSLTTKENFDGQVKGITIAEIIENNSLNKISLLKIDIEGAERFIFKKENDLSFLGITEIIAIEIHDEFDIRESINDILLQNNFFLMSSGELTVGINKALFQNDRN